jgi:hypothetical protein
VLSSLNGLVAPLLSEQLRPVAVFIEEPLPESDHCCRLSEVCLGPRAALSSALFPQRLCGNYLVVWTLAA